jgi:membrane-associated protein
MDLIRQAVDLFLHLDKHLGEIIQQYGTWTYAILTLVVFCETGLVVTPFLPGDSLLFAAGALAALPGSPLSVFVLFLLLTGAAIAGDTVNYWIGHKVGPRAFEGKIKFLNPNHLARTHEFYEKYGGKTIIIARFVPIVRTFAPFVAGVGSMSYGKFITYNVVGGILWVAICLFAGFFFGNLPFVKANFSLVIIAIIIISVLPGVYEFARHRMEARRRKPPSPPPPAVLAAADARE